MRSFREMEKLWDRANVAEPTKIKTTTTTEIKTMTQKQQIEQLQQETKELRTENTAIVEFMYTLLERIDAMDETINTI